MKVQDHVGGAVVFTANESVNWFVNNSVIKTDMTSAVYLTGGFEVYKIWGLFSANLVKGAARLWLFEENNHHLWIYTFGKISYNTATGMLAGVNMLQKFNMSTVFQVGTAFEYYISPTPYPIVAPPMIVTLAVTMTVGGVNAITFNTPTYTNAFKQSIVSSIPGTKAEDITITSITDITTKAESAFVIQKKDPSHIHTEGSGVNIAFVMKIEIVGNTFTDPITASSSMAQALTTAVTSGSFQSYMNFQLEAQGATPVTVDSAPVIVIVLPTTSPSLAPTTSPTLAPQSEKSGQKTGLSDGAIAGIVIGVVVFVVLLVFGYLFYSGQLTTQKDTNAIRDANSTTILPVIQTAKVSPAPLPVETPST